MNAIFNRCSTRVFTTKEIDDSKIELLLKAAMQAPSCANQQPWEFIVVKGTDNLEELSKNNPYANSLQNADVAIILFANKKRCHYLDYWQQDLAASTQNILLQATEMGIGSVWYGICPEKDRMEHINNLYKLDDNYLPFAIVGLGYPKNDEFKPTNRFDPSRVIYIK